MMPALPSFASVIALIIESTIQTMHELQSVSIYYRQPHLQAKGSNAREADSRQELSKMPATQPAAWKVLSVA